MLAEIQQRILGIFLLPILLTPCDIMSQTIDFSDNSLKTYLLEHQCVDTIGYANGISHRFVDVNQDGEIQLTEAESVKHLNIGSFAERNSTILSLSDLDYFTNLSSLYISKLDSLLEISNLGLDSLKSLYIDDCRIIKRIDLSNLEELTDVLRIESIKTLDYLNIQNGNVTDLFSMFYSKDIKEACIDTFAKEELVILSQQAMKEGVFPKIDCTVSNNAAPPIDPSEIKIYSNPVHQYAKIESQFQVDYFTLIDLFGHPILAGEITNNTIDMTTIHAGLYFLHLSVEDDVIVKRILKL